MIRNRITIYSLVFVIVLLFYNCSSITTSKSEIEIENKTWSVTDSEFIVDSLVNKILNSKKIKEFGKKPAIIVGKIENFSNENIAPNFFEKNIERGLVSSGKITFIKSKVKREKIRTNRKNRNDFGSKKEFGNYLKPLKSDFFIDGKFELFIDSLNSSVTKEYKLSVQIFNSKNYKLISAKTVKIIK